jgi:hypothetical protein
MQRLTAVVWPVIAGMIESQLAALPPCEQQCVAVVEAAVLLEAGWDSMCDEVC